MIEAGKKTHFSYDLEATLTEDERKACEKLRSMKEDLVSPLHNVVIRDFYENKPKVEASRYYSALDSMPKGALHHIHTTAAPPVDVYLKLTYEPIVYFNERDGLFKVFTKN